LNLNYSESAQKEKSSYRPLANYIPDVFETYQNTAPILFAV